VEAAGFRAVPNCVVRNSAYIAPGVVLMPSFVNLGAYVDSGTMVDTWATVGSCAQIGKNVHLSGGVGIGGVLEPMQAGPTIIEDNCFIGARSEVVEGCIVREGSVLGMGVFIGQSTKIVDRETGRGHVWRGARPPWSWRARCRRRTACNLYCAVIVKRVDEKTRGQDLDQRAAARLASVGGRVIGVFGKWDGFSLSFWAASPAGSPQASWDLPGVFCAISSSAFWAQWWATSF
jgi:2,3,4,5-tetrahydropyridine-2-carboxylate N-succinyltransferase